MKPAQLTRFVQTRHCSGSALLRTPLYDFHKAQGAKFGPFAGYDMPIQYPTGLMKEHKAARTASTLFDVSHMGQWVVRGDDREAFIERLTPMDLAQFTEGTGSLTVMTNEKGGIIDDTIIVKHAKELHMVVNAGCQDKDYAHALNVIAEGKFNVEIERLDRALVALQGPTAAAVLTKYDAKVADLPFMGQTEVQILGQTCVVTRCGYTGEDGFEISLPIDTVEPFCQKLVDDEVVLAGLGARDSLRLEAGLCLYGNDMDETTTPIEAGLSWLITKRRMAEGGFLGADVVRHHSKAKRGEEGAFAQKRVCLTVQGPPARSGALLKNADGVEVGRVTSGTYSPTLGGGVAMAYVNRNLQKAGTELQVEVRNKLNKATVVKAPFVPHNYVAK